MTIEVTGNVSFHLDGSLCSIFLFSSCLTGTGLRYIQIRKCTNTCTDKVEQFVSFAVTGQLLDSFTGAKIAREEIEIL